MKSMQPLIVIVLLIISGIITLSNCGIATLFDLYLYSNGLDIAYFGIPIALFVILIIWLSSFNNKE